MKSGDLERVSESGAGALGPGPPLPPGHQGAPASALGTRLAAGSVSPEAERGGGGGCRTELGSLPGGPWRGYADWLREDRGARESVRGLSERALPDGSPCLHISTDWFPFPLGPSVAGSPVLIGRPRCFSGLESASQPRSAQLRGAPALRVSKRGPSPSEPLRLPRLSSQPRRHAGGCVCKVQPGGPGRLWVPSRAWEG